MKVREIGNTFSFSFESSADIEAYNAWLDEINMIHARVMLPIGMPARSFRRVMTKRPSILRVDNEHSREVIADRWLVNCPKGD